MPKYEVELSDDFLEAVAVRAAEIIEARRSHWLYGDKAAAEYLGWPVGRVTKLRQRGELPGGTVQLKDGVGGTIRYQWVLAANGNASLVFSAPALPVFISGVQVVISGTDATCTIDLL